MDYRPKNPMYTRIKRMAGLALLLSSLSTISLTSGCGTPNYEEHPWLWDGDQGVLRELQKEYEQKMQNSNNK